MLLQQYVALCNGRNQASVCDLIYSTLQLNLKCNHHHSQTFTHFGSCLVDRRLEIKRRDGLCPFWTLYIRTKLHLVTTIATLATGGARWADNEVTDATEARHGLAACTRLHDNPYDIN